jgi:hypothetical protein
MVLPAEHVTVPAAKSILKRSLGKPSKRYPCFLGRLDGDLESAPGTLGGPEPGAHLEQHGVGEAPEAPQS